VPTTGPGLRPSASCTSISLASFDHMVVGQQVALGRDDDARAQAHCAASAAVAEEEAEARVVGMRAARELGGGDADHGRRSAPRGQRKAGPMPAPRPTQAGGRLATHDGVGSRQRAAVPPGRARRGSHCGFSVATTNSTPRPRDGLRENEPGSTRIAAGPSGEGQNAAWPFATDIENSLQMLLRPDDSRIMGRTACRSRAREVRHVVSGVTASLAFIDAAIAAGADTCWCTTACSGAATTAA
jgi:hypothetical protein